MSLLFRLISWLPFWLLYPAASVVYFLLFHVSGYRKQVVKQNLERAFPEKSAKEITHLRKKFYRQLSQVALEIIKARRMTREDFLERMPIRNPELLKQYSKDFTESVIILTIHQGNWEWMLHGAVAGLGVPIAPVYKPLHNKAADKMIYDIRSQFGLRPLSVEESTRDIIKHRREFRVFVMVADQAPTRKERGLWTQFMNQEAKFYLGGEVLAKMTKFPVLFVRCHRKRPGFYEMEFLELAQAPYEKDSHLILERYIETAEAAIRSEPESWLWSNRRWKRDRGTEEARETAEREAT
ncbi:MAG: lysophospholipid acyltransferase family protein [Pseudomonadota bacterium]